MSILIAEASEQPLPSGRVRSEPPLELVSCAKMSPPRRRRTGSWDEHELLLQDSGEWTNSLLRITLRGLHSLLYSNFSPGLDDSNVTTYIAVSKTPNSGCHKLYIRQSDALQICLKAWSALKCTKELLLR